MEMNLTMCARGGSSDGRGGFVLQFHYDTEFVEELKRTIPHTHREWMPESKIWWVSKDYDEILQKLFANFYSIIHLQGSLF